MLHNCFIISTIPTSSVSPVTFVEQLNDAIIRKCEADNIVTVNQTSKYLTSTFPAINIRDTES
jgi:hypothetical protein